MHTKNLPVVTRNLKNSYFYIDIRNNGVYNVTVIRFYLGDYTIKNKTLLEKFINERLDKYIEPSRKGTPKGEQIGFLYPKYKATLFHLKNMKGEDIAKAVNVGHGLLRKWRTEKFFLNAIGNHYRDFIVLFIENLAEFKPELFKDFLQYHPVLLKEITTAMFSFLKDRKDANLALLIHYLLILKRYVPEDIVGNTILWSTQKAAILGIIRTVKENISKKDYERAVSFLDLLAKII